MSNATKENKITLRIYDETFLIEMNNTYVLSKSRFESKNHFFITLLRLGLESYLNSIKTPSKKIDLSELNEIKQLLFNFIDFYKRQIDISEAHFNVCEKLISSTSSMVEAIANGDSISIDDVNEGEYDDLPERLEKIILEAKFK